MYWEHQLVVLNAAVAKFESRSKFEDILHYLHVVDNKALQSEEIDSNLKLGLRRPE